MHNQQKDETCGQECGNDSRCKKPKGHDGSCNPLYGMTFAAAPAGDRETIPEGKLSNYDSPETIVEHIVGMVADDGSITDYARELAIDYVRTRLKYSEPEDVQLDVEAEKQQEIDISNLRFYSRMAAEFKWGTDIIHFGVIEQTLKEIADRLALLRRVSGKGAFADGLEAAAQLIERVCHGCDCKHSEAYAKLIRARKGQPSPAPVPATPLTVPGCPECNKPLIPMFGCSDSENCCSAWDADDPRITNVPPAVELEPIAVSKTEINTFAEHLASGIDGFNNFQGKARIIDWIRGQAESWATTQGTLEGAK